ncbi:hypothetical protein FSP39_021310 [Pinctada imbricata]|uniref:Peptidase M14 domain-containing protein n=1 Tax=Pinctada imbricata TaxID=66713 RepID=A0AA88Y060_PINIB|nr:hypothetical protein FSP39_021310 [Pinctada imbricata]
MTDILRRRGVLSLNTRAGVNFTQNKMHQVLHIAPRSLTDLDTVLALHRTHEVDVWRHPTTWNQTLDVYVAPDKIEAFLDELKLINVEVKVWIHDLQRLMDEEKVSLARKARHPKTSQGKNKIFHTYLRYDEIRNFLRNAESDSLRTDVVRAERKIIGTTYEGREIELIHISKGDSPNKKKIFIDGGVHAREWISPAFTLYIIYQLVYNTSNDDVKTLLNHFDWYIVPVLNPDGYEYSHTQNRLWRKNRSPNRRGCVGTDVNRNFGYQWNPRLGGSSDPCSDLFSGNTSFSEEESRALQNFILANNDNMIAYFTVHSYGQLWLYPWGYTNALLDDWMDLEHLANVSVSALRQKHGTQYTVGSSTRVLYSAAGNSHDWAKGEAGIKYSYTLELRDKEQYGFLLPEDQIKPTSEETWTGLVAFSKALLLYEG